MLNHMSQNTEANSAVDLPHLAKWLKVLAEPRRLAIVDLLMQGIQCNCELSRALNMPANLISHHLRVLRRAGLVEVERDTQDGRWLYYAINQEALEELNRMFAAFFNPGRVQERQPFCGPQGAATNLDEIPLISR